MQQKSAIATGKTNFNNKQSITLACAAQIRTQMVYKRPKLSKFYALAHFVVDSKLQEAYARLGGEPIINTLRSSNGAF